MPDVLTTREVAEQLGVQEWEIENALRRREVERPSMAGGVRLWSAEHVAKLRDALVRRGRLAQKA